MSFTDRLNAINFDYNSISQYSPMLDPTTFTLMNRPVIWDENTFDLGALQTWAQACNNNGKAVTNPITRAALPVARVEDLPQNLAVRDIIEQFVKKKVEKSKVNQKPAAAPAATLENDPSIVTRQTSAQIFEQYKDAFISHYWIQGRLTSFLSIWDTYPKWDIYSGGITLPEFGFGEPGAKEWFAYFLRNPGQRVRMLRLIVRFEDLHPLKISLQDIEKLASQTESELGIVSPPVAVTQPKSSVPAVNPTAYLEAQSYNSLGSIFAYPPSVQPQQAQKPAAAAPAAPLPALSSSELVATVTDAERERRLLRMTDSWLTHFGNFERLKLLISTWNSNISPALPSLGSNHQAALTAHSYFRGRRTTLGPLFAILAHNPDLRPDTLSAEEAIRFGDPETLRKLSNPSHQASSAEKTKPSVAPITLPASSIVNDSLREQTMRRMSESWSQHFGDVNKLALLCAAWNAYITEKEHLPDFGDTHTAQNEALNYFIGKRSTLANLFALLAHFDDLRPEGLRKEDAARLANPDTLSRLVARDAMTD